MLSVEEFIDDALTQIAGGVAKFAERKDVTGTIPNPRGLKFQNEPNGSLILIRDEDTKSQGDKSDDFSTDTVTSVEFDIALTENSEATGGMEMKLAVPAVGEIGGNLGARASGSIVSRVRFRIPILLPRTDPHR